MAPLAPQFLRFRKFFLFYLLASSLVASSSFVLASSRPLHSRSSILLGRRILLQKIEQNDDDDLASLLSPKNKKTPTSSSSSSSSSSSNKNQTKLLKPSSTSSSSSSSSSKNQTELIKSTSSSNSSQKNQTKLSSTTSSSQNFAKLAKPTSSKNVGASPNLTKIKLNSTKSLDPIKSTSSSKNKTKSSATTVTKLPQSDDSAIVKVNVKQQLKKETHQTQKPPSPSTPWNHLLYQDYNDDDYDFMAGIRDLPTRFHQSFVPDMHKLSTTSKIYLTKANKEITRNFVKPYVGNKYASSVSTAISCAFIVIPFLLVSLIFNHITAYFSLQKLVIFVQIYLAIYFSILCLSSLITGLEPLRFFYATSQSTYVWLQVLQTLGYVMYLLMLLMYLILVFSTESGLGQKFLSLAQTFVGFAVGLHYYITVFHRVLLHQPPKTNWKVHGIYAACFVVICLLARADRRKKAYLEQDGEEGKQS